MVLIRKCMVLAAFVAVLSPTLAHAATLTPEEQTDVNHWRGGRYAVTAAIRWVTAVEQHRAEVAASHRRTVSGATDHGPVSRAAPASAPSSNAAPLPGLDMSCGGNLPPCYRLMTESHGATTVWNGGCSAPVGWTGKSPCGVSSASGKWQIVRGTWGGYGGYLNAADAPGDVQDARAAQIWAGGAGCSNWSAC